MISLFVTESVENLMADTHDLGGSTVVVDRATPKACRITASPFILIVNVLMEAFLGLSRKQK